MIKFKKIVDGEFTIFEVTGLPGDTIRTEAESDRERDKLAASWYYVKGLTNTYREDGSLFVTRYPDTFSRELDVLPKGKYNNIIEEEILYYCMSRTDKAPLDINIFRKNNGETFDVAKGNHIFVASGLVTIHSSRGDFDAAAPAIINVESEDVTITSHSKSVSFRLK